MGELLAAGTAVKAEQHFYLFEYELLAERSTGPRPTFFARVEGLHMQRVRVESFSISVDGLGAGRDQSLENPLGVGGKALHGWAFTTRTLRQMFGQEGGETGEDDRFAARGFENVGAWVLGRNMFGPIRGPWPDESWKGWWGDTPPYHCPVFVLTHHSRRPLEMDGGTVFHFVTDGFESVLRQARDAARGKDVRLCGVSLPSGRACGQG